MAVKYFFRYRNTDNIDFRCEIESDNYTGDSTEIGGRCVLEYAEVDGHFTPLRGSGMTMRLDASIELNFDDLATENERVYKTTLFLGTDIIFVGFIDPEGIYEDWVNDRWTMEVSVVGGLGFLENLSYVQDNGLPFAGQQSIFDIIYNCLRRTGLELKVNTSTDFETVGFVSNEGFGDINILDKVKLITDRFFREDEETIMDCKEVLESTLNILNACVCQMNGEWFVFKTSAMMRPEDGQVFFSYNADGSAVLGGKQSISTKVVIGSHINDTSIFHVNANQRKERKNSLSAFKVNYKYGLLDSIFVNEEMKVNGILGNPGTLEGWSYLDDTKLGLYNYDGEVYLTLLSYRGQDDLYAGDTPASVIISDQIDVIEGTSLTFDFNVIEDRFINSVLVKVFLNTGGFVYYLDIDNGWVESGTGNEIIYLTGEGNPVDDFNNWKVQTAPMIGDGTITFTFMQPRTYFPLNSNDKRVYIQDFKVYPSADNTVNGEFHTVKRTSATSNRVGDVLEVYNGDNEENIYEGTIYRNDGITQTAFWKRNFLTESKPLLRLVAEERLRLYAKIQTVFSGDVYGYVPYLSKITINGVDGSFMAISNTYDSHMNTTSLVLLQGYTDEINDIDYEFELDYGNVVKPTIK